VLGAPRPVQRWRTLPMVLGGAPTVDFLAPMRGVFARLAAARRRPGVRAASVLCCQPWHDAPALGWTASVVAEPGSGALADELVDGLADAMWAVRDALPANIAGPEEAIERARSASVRRRLGTVCIADTSDAVGAGGVGENTALLRALIERGRGLSAYVPLRDAVAVERLWAHPDGATVEVELGGRLAPAWYSPYAVRGAIVGRREDTALGGRSVVLRCGEVRIVVTAEAPIAIGPRFFRDVGLSPWRADACVMKSWVGFRLHMLPYNRLSLWARTRGVTDLDAMRDIAYDVPVHPFARLDGWRDADRRRRGGSAGTTQSDPGGSLK
jgi:microcystin degradation protein MlrC